MENNRVYEILDELINCITTNMGNDKYLRTTIYNIHPMSICDVLKLISENSIVILHNEKKEFTDILYSYLIPNVHTRGGYWFPEFDFKIRLSFLNHVRYSISTNTHNYFDIKKYYEDNGTFIFNNPRDKGYYSICKLTKYYNINRKIS